MLCLSLQPGEYLTIGDDIVLQYDHTSGNACRLVIQAPREIPVLRGAVRERTGQTRPGCVFDGPHPHRRDLPWNRSKSEALSAMRRLLASDRNDQTFRDLRRQLNHIFPPDERADAPITPISPGTAARLK